MVDSTSGDAPNIAFQQVGEATRFRVRVQPRAARTAIAGDMDGMLKVRIAAPPVDGAANDELIRFLAKRLGCARGNVRILSGAAGRSKHVEVAGLDPITVAARLR